MPVDVQLVTDSAVPDVENVQRWAEGALIAAGRCRGGRAVAASRAREGAPTASATEGELCVRVVDEDESQGLNRDYRGEDAPTNVLSFPADVDLPGMSLWGDVVICAPVVQREAAAQHKRYEDHFAHMVVHGVLHLFGYDHQSAAEAAAMEQLEIRVLDTFGISDPYGEG